MDLTAKPQYMPHIVTESEDIHYNGLIESFLGHRKQPVLLDGCRSSQADVISGVPQGTKLGSLFFLAFINNLPEAVNHSDSRLFADDCLL